MRLREFRQVEIELFFNPKKSDEVPNFGKISSVAVPILTREAQEKEGKIKSFTAKQAAEKQIVPSYWTAYFMAKEYLWYRELGLPADAIRFRHMQQHETPHYSKGNFDMEIKFDFGWKEVVGNAYRSDFDLTAHGKKSGENFAVVVDGEKIIPHVVEPSFGIDRTIYAILLYAWRDGKERGWEWLKLPAKIAPISFGVFPLMNKDKIPKKAREIYESIKKFYEVIYDESGSIGKRYARADESGVPFCITVDYDSLKKETVTIRDRDSTKQIVVKIKDLSDVLWKLLDGEIKFEKAGKLVK